MGIPEKLSYAIRGFNPEKYFLYRKKFYDTKSRLKRMYYKYKVMKIEKNNAYIGLFSNEENHDIFKNPPKLLHGISGIFITAKARIGENVTIMQGVTIGKSNDKAPVIGDNVFIGANACVLGDIKVGNNVRIGAGAVVVKDVPDNTTVVSQPCRYINKHQDYKYSVDGE